MVSLIVDLPDESFTASSTASDHRPYDGRLVDMSIYGRIPQPSGKEYEKNFILYTIFILPDAWLPRYNTIGQYIQVDLLEEQPVYGIIISGSVYMESYTTTFNILYSSDDYIFSYVEENNRDIAQVKQL